MAEPDSKDDEAVQAETGGDNRREVASDRPAGPQWDQWSLLPANTECHLPNEID